MRPGPSGLPLFCGQCVLQAGALCNVVRACFCLVLLSRRPVQVNKIVAVVSNPLQFKIPSWMLNRQRCVKDGKTSQKFANFLDQALREARPSGKLIAAVVAQLCLLVFG